MSADRHEHAPAAFAAGAVGPLVRLCPPPDRSRRAAVDWAAVQDALGTALPADYRRLVEVYGGGLFAGSVWLLEPGCPEPMYDLVAQAAECRENLAGLWAAGEPKPPELGEEGAGLLPWAYVEGAGHVLYWLVRPGAEPEEWTVLLNEGRGPEWEAHPVPCSRFVLDVVAGTSPSYYFTDLDDRTRFLPNAQLLGR